MSADRQLVALAKASGIEPTYVDVHGEEQAADPDVLRALLGHLGVTATTVDEAGRSHWSRALDAVTVAWEGRAAVVVRAATDLPPEVLHLRTADGTEHTVPVAGERALEGDDALGALGVPGDVVGAEIRVVEPERGLRAIGRHGGTVASSS